MMMKHHCAVLIAAAALCLPVVVRSAPENREKHKMESTADRQKAVFRQYIGIWERGDLQDLPKVLAPDYVGHASTGDRGIDGLRDRISVFRKEYVDAHFNVELQMAEGDRVATRMTATAIATATGAHVTLIGLNISRFEGGRIVEEWPVWEVSR
jgi:predicted ester cyclase